MNKGQYVFTQLINFLDRHPFSYLSRKYDGNRYVKPFTCRNQLLALMSGQFNNRESREDSNEYSNYRLLNCDYCPNDMQLKRSTYEVLQILNISLTDKTPLRDFFEKIIFNDVNEPDYPVLPELFDY